MSEYEPECPYCGDTGTIREGAVDPDGRVLERQCPCAAGERAVGEIRSSEAVLGDLLVYLMHRLPAVGSELDNIRRKEIAALVAEYEESRKRERLSSVHVLRDLLLDSDPVEFGRDMARVEPVIAAKVALTAFACMTSDVAQVALRDLGPNFMGESGLQTVMVRTKSGTVVSLDSAQDSGVPVAVFTSQP